MRQGSVPKIWFCCYCCCLVTMSCLTLLWPHGLKPSRLLCPWNFLGKNTKMGCHFLLQGFFLTQELNLCLPHWQADSLPLSYQRSPKIWLALHKWGKKKKAYRALICASESEVTQSWPTLCDPMDCSLPGSSIHGIFKATVLEWVAISFFRGSSRLRDWIWVSHVVGRCFTIWATREVPGSIQVAFIYYLS